jgi:hypothetical protein
MALAACQSDGALDVLAQPQAVGEHLGQGQDREAEDQRAADGGCEQAPRFVGRQARGEPLLERQEQDLLWLPDQLDPANEHRQFRRLWLRLVAALHQNGRPVLLCGTVVSGQLEACPERRLVGEIHYLALVCDDAELENRLRARPAWRAWTEEKVARMMAFNRWVKRNAATTTPPMELLDTSGHSMQDSAARVQAWAMARLAASG